jgi:hypothetical protein
MGLKEILEELCKNWKKKDSGSIEYPNPYEIKCNKILRNN